MQLVHSVQQNQYDTNISVSGECITQRDTLTESNIFVFWHMRIKA